MPRLCETDGLTEDQTEILKAVRVFYTARIVGGELTDEADGTTDEARWIPLAEVSDLPRVSMVDTGLRLFAERE